MWPRSSLRNWSTVQTNVNTSNTLKVVACLLRAHVLCVDVRWDIRRVGRGLGRVPQTEDLGGTRPLREQSVPFSAILPVWKYTNPGNLNTYNQVSISINFAAGPPAPPGCFQIRIFGSIATYSTERLVHSSKWAASKPRVIYHSSFCEILCSLPEVSCVTAVNSALSVLAQHGWATGQTTLATFWRPSHRFW